MVLALSRFGGKSCSLVPLFALVLGGAGYFLPLELDEPAVVASTSISSDILQIDAVLARRAPELGLALRQRVAEAILEEAREARFDPLLVLGLIEIESEFDGRAVSSAGARGLMQLRPATAEYLAGLEGLRLTTNDIYRDPALQVRLATRYLARLEKRFGQLDLALMAYNAGPEKLRQSMEQGDVERFRNYARAVRRTFERFRRGVRLSADGALAQVDRVSSSDSSLSPRTDESLADPEEAVVMP